jgi:hypothetical protein
MSGVRGSRLMGEDCRGGRSRSKVVKGVKEQE